MDEVKELMKRVERYRVLCMRLLNELDFDKSFGVLEDIWEEYSYMLEEKSEESRRNLKEKINELERMKGK